MRTTEALSQGLSERLDYGHAREFGYFLVPDAGDPVAALETARLADGVGYDRLGVQDHPYQPRHLDTHSLLGAILAQTEAVRVFADVGNLPLRPGQSLEALEEAVAVMRSMWSGERRGLRFELGFGTFVLATEPDVGTLTTFIEDVAPEVRERVAERRASREVPAEAPEPRR